MAPVQLPDGVTAKEFWVIRVSGVEWLYVMTKLVERYKLLEKQRVAEIADVFGIDDTPTASAVFFLRKSEVPVEEVMRVTGKSREDLETSEQINLTVKRTPNLPLPTVSYWGTA